MPRGVYDRKKSKASKQQPQLPGAPTTKTGTIVAGAVTAEKVTASVIHPSDAVQPLYMHLTTLVQSRATLLQGQHELHPMLTQVVDQEIIATFGALRAWREKNFPVESDKSKKVQDAAQAPSGVFAPAPSVSTAPSAPLPFTPAAVQDALRPQASPPLPTPSPQ